MRGKMLKMSDAFIIERAVGKWIQGADKARNGRRILLYIYQHGTGSGEREAIKLCKQLNAKYLIADDEEARRVAKMLNVTPIGTCGIILWACKEGIMTKDEAKQMLHDLLKVGFRVDLELYCRILNELELKL